MKTGRPKTPTNLKILNGNPGKRPLPKNEPKPAPITPNRPAWVTGEGKKMWDRLVPELEKLGLITIVDGEAFAAACHSWGTYVECQKFFKKKDPSTKKKNGRTYEYTNSQGSTNIIERPEVKIGQKALGEFRAFCSEFGLTPAARTRIEVKMESNDIDKTEALLSGVK